MTPRPLENVQQGPMVGAFMPEGSGGRGSISLAMLFDFIIQRTYQELTVLAEL